MSSKPWRVGCAMLSQRRRGCGRHWHDHSAQLSELRDRITITPDDLAKFSQERAEDMPDAWQGGGRIIRAPCAPFPRVDNV